jgi:hypothetical protein
MIMIMNMNMFMKKKETKSFGFSKENAVFFGTSYNFEKLIFEKGDCVRTAYIISPYTSSCLFRHLFSSPCYTL